MWRLRLEAFSAKWNSRWFYREVNSSFSLWITVKSTAWILLFFFAKNSLILMEVMEKPEISSKDNNAWFSLVRCTRHRGYFSWAEAHYPPWDVPDFHPYLCYLVPWQCQPRIKVHIKGQQQEVSDTISKITSAGRAEMPAILHSDNRISSSGLRGKGAEQWQCMSLGLQNAKNTHSS